MFDIGVKAWNYAKIAFSTEKPQYLRKQQYKSFILSLWEYGDSGYWFTILESDRYREILSYRPRLFLKPFKAYLSTRYDIRRKIKIICDTYDFIYDHNLKKIIHKDDWVICEFPLKNNLPGRLEIGYNDRYRKEGELVFSLVIDHLHGKIASVSFSLERNKKDEWVCKIGCLQGRPAIDGTYVTKEAQKLMYGIRPKSFLIEILQEFCKEFDVKLIMGIGGKYQVQNKKHFIHLPFIHTICFSYDNFWKEIGGRNTGIGWYILPLETSRKNMDDIKSEKRASYKKRYALMDFVKESLCIYLR
ncbi:DUF535 family protein [Chryseobacterium culicis]|uniref:DUF535 domain-containing protein n=1 Tax=Chryseobacterium culicis TaxID=680127 RepID=A0A2S9D1N2_CHRCI|nr:DUF535 family protein [Chryseobacterium culicis]PRB86640.1 hypothetical protein CQ022_10410 [Chryseobacterium culicis]PRB92393.1 hypothetical protein CQ033_04080 [Chryseobacterium culicis]